ncbi:MAG: SpoIIE family protein phosphatase [Streptosporangiaceae bacterium]|jgi:stage II sporulation SpoE-like protein/GAF domain-containing protein
MPDDLDTAAGPHGNILPAGLTAAEAELKLRGSLDLAEIARLVLDATVPGFANAAAVFASEQLIRAGEPVEMAADCKVTARRLGTRLTHESRRVTEAAFPAGEVIAFDADSPYGRCVRDGQPLIFALPDSGALEWVGPAGRKIMSRYASYLAVPMVAGRQPTGFLAFARTAGSPAFSDADVTAATRLAAVTGTGIANALTLLRQQSVADTLQQSLIAAEPVVPPGIEIAARCLPAAGQIVGGDWYDIIALPAGRCGIIVGDVMGHGPAAAAVMAQLRAAAHALAQLDLEPAELLSHLDRTTTTLRRPVLATCVYAVIDPASQSCVLSAAGHLPPVLAMPDGATRVPDLPAGQSLGLGMAVYGQSRIKLPPGTVIALYTDGLVETRTRSFDQGISALRAVLDCRHDQLGTACDTLIASLAERAEDDVTVVLARTP